MFSGERKTGNDDAPAIDTLIGENTTVTGDVRFQGGLHVDGHIDGSVATADGQAGHLNLSERGSIKGEIRVPVVVINGRVDGDIIAGERLELQTKARVSGNVRYRTIQMHLGSEINGQLLCEAEGDATPAKRLAEAPIGAKPRPPEPVLSAALEAEPKAGRK